MTYAVGAAFLAFCGLIGSLMDGEHAAVAAIAIGALLIIAAEWCIYMDEKRDE